MKRKKNLASFLLIISVILMSMSSGNYQEDEDGKAGHNGSPSEQTCAKSSCHTTFTLNSGPGEVTISAPGMTDWQYTPGQIYNISVTISQTGMPLFGFGFEALLASGANAGTLTAGTGSHAVNFTVGGNSRKTITHLLDAGLTSNSHTFTFTWVAPATAVPVTFYAAGNAANNNGTKLGDYIYTSSQAVTPIVLPTAPTITASGPLLLCNGATVNLTVPSQTGATFEWFNASNVSVGTGLSYTASVTGCYHAVATTSGGSAESVNEICVTASSVSAEFSGLQLNFCVDASPINLTAQETGGTFSGPGVAGIQFDPAAAGPGQHTITYSITNAAGCVATSTQNVQVIDLLSAEFTGLEATFCADADPVNLVPENTGGQFSGDGLNGNTFDPTAVAAGDYTIEYVLGPASCQTTYSLTTTVLQPLDDSFSGLSLEYCSNAAPVNLIPNSTSGIFSGAGVFDAQFDPAAAGIGTHEVVFTVSDIGGCQSSSSQIVVVNEFVTAEFTGLETQYCENVESVQLIPTYPGGTFSGLGVENSTAQFNPQIGAGLYEVFYEVGEGSCATSSSQNVEVLSVEDASFTGLQNGYCSASDSTQLIPTTPNGLFEGYAVYGDYFYPASAVIGENVISHTVTSENGCVNTATFTVFVYETANSNFTGIDDNYCLNNDAVNMVPENAGGVFSGDGVVDGTFEPAIAGVGTHTITYDVDFVGCASSTSITTIVNDLPDASLTGLDNSYCEDAAAVTITTASAQAVITGEGILGNEFSPSSAGVGTHEIFCNVTDENGCSDTWSTTVNVIATPNAAFTVTGPVASAELSGATYQWINCDNNNAPISGATQQNFTASENGEYTVEVTLNGCSATAECAFILVFSVDELGGKTNLNVYPNPVNDIVSLVASKPGKVQIYNMAGKRVWQDNYMLSSRQVDLQELPAGIYTIRFVDANDHEVISKLIKQ